MYHAASQVVKKEQLGCRVITYSKQKFLSTIHFLFVIKQLWLLFVKLRLLRPTWLRIGVDV